MGESNVYMGEYEVYMDSHVKRILHGDGCFAPCKIIYLVESLFHQLDLVLHGEGDCLDGGIQCLHGESVFHQLDLGLHGEGDCLDGGG